MDVAELPLVGGHPAVDLVNTLERGAQAPGVPPHDYLVDPAALLVWAGRVGLVDDVEAQTVSVGWDRAPGSAAAALAATHELREALHDVLLLATGHRVPAGAGAAVALERLHGRWAAALGRATLVLDLEPEPLVRLHVGLAPGMLIPDRAADAGLDLLRGPDLPLVKRCPVDLGGCGWMFVDRTRNGSRRWCRMADCGTQVKIRRLTERRRDARTRRPPMAHS
jgi:predicted RNA-binding Zn ribbon-like protein